jgi:23S rRNA (adenine2030-N6)-methyltransferase
LRPQADGLAGCIGLLPRKELRGLTLIDPAYEVKSDYRAAVETLVSAHRRFATGVFALCYPILNRSSTDAMERAIRAAEIPKVQVYELGIAPQFGARHGRKRRARR